MKETWKILNSLVNKTKGRNKLKQTEYRIQKQTELSVEAFQKAIYYLFNNKIQESVNSMKETWKILNSLINKTKGRKNYPTHFLDNNTKDTDYNTIANKFCSYFSNIGSNLAKNIPKVDVNYKTFLKESYTNSLFFNDTTPEEIESITMKLKNKSSCGFDEISTTLVKNIIPSISGPLSEIVNLSLFTGILPDKMKIAKVIPLFKSGDNNVYKNYRPVSVLPSLSKIIEKIVYYRLIDYINKFASRRMLIALGTFTSSSRKFVDLSYRALLFIAELLCGRRPQSGAPYSYYKVCWVFYGHGKRNGSRARAPYDRRIS